VRSWETTPKTQGRGPGYFESDLGQEWIGHIDRAILIEFGRKHAKKEAGPVSLGIR